MLAWDKRKDTGLAMFRIALRHDDRSVLELVQSFLACGWITYGNPNISTANARPTTLFCVAKARDLARIVVPHFEKCPQYAKKARDFGIWKRGVDLLYRVTRKRLIGLGGRRGFRSRWKADDKAAFQALVLALKDVRRFDSPLIAIPESLPSLLPDRQGRLFGS